MKTTIFLLLISTISFCQAPFQKTEYVYKKQRKCLEISRLYHDFEREKDKAMMFGIIGGIMAPTILAFIVCKNNKDNFGQGFYGAYAAIDIGASFMAVRSEIKARKIRKKYMKLDSETQEK